MVEVTSDTGAILNLKFKSGFTGTIKLLSGPAGEAGTKYRFIGGEGLLTLDLDSNQSRMDVFDLGGRRLVGFTEPSAPAGSANSPLTIRDV